MKYPASLSGHRICAGKSRLCLRERWLLGMVALTLVRTGCAAGADHVALGGHGQPAAPRQHLVPRMDSLIPAMRLSPQITLTGVTVQAPAVYSSSEFRPRAHSLFDPAPPDTEVAAPMLRGTNVWQRLRDYHSHDRVRLLTLWESSGGAFSLQASKKGDPSLQWTSNSLNRGGATRGLLDRVFAMALAASAGNRSHDGPGSASMVRGLDRPLERSLSAGAAK